MNPTLVVIPARAGSEGVPRKHVRLLGDRPLIAWTIRTALQVPDADVCLTTDDDEIALLGLRYGGARMQLIQRPAPLAVASVPLDPVVAHALRMMEVRRAPYATVLTLQATSPFLTLAAVQAVLAIVQSRRATTAVTVADDRHLRWTGVPMSRTRGVAPARVNRQAMPPSWRETGGALATARRFVTEQSRFGPHVELVPVSGREALDIDTWPDWWAAEAYARQCRVAYRTDGGGAFGLGHVYRAVTLARAATGHEVRLFMDARKYPDGVALAERLGAAVDRLTTGTDEEWTAQLGAFDPHVVIVETGATTSEQIAPLRTGGRLVVTWEDAGPGAQLADLTFNDLWSPPLDGPQRFQGPRYAILREEFAGVHPGPLVTPAQTVLVTFGGTDPNNLTVLALGALPRDLRVFVALGSGYCHQSDAALHARYDECFQEFIVRREVRHMSELMLACDAAVTSCGRTIYELAACGVPMLCLPQNAWERAHVPNAARMAALVVESREPPAIQAALATLLSDGDYRTAARAQLLAQDLRHGAARFWEIVQAALRERSL